MTRLIIRGVSAVSAALLSLATAPRAEAQDIPVVFAHGIFSDSATWNAFTPWLAQQLQMSPVAKTTSYKWFEANQAGQLSYELDLDSRTANPSLRLPFVAHSNGGLVVRRFGVNDLRVRNLLTMATPHRGSALAANYLSYAVANYGVTLANTLLDPIDYYMNADPVVPLWLGDAEHVFYDIWHGIFDNMDDAMCPVAGFCPFFDGVNNIVAPLAYDLVPNSNTLDNVINSQSNLLRESSAIANRIGLWTNINAKGALWKLMDPDNADWLATEQGGTIALYLTLYDHYSESGDYNLYMNRDRWLNGAFALRDLDLQWMSLIGAEPEYVGCPFDWFQLCISVWANDGLILRSSAEFPGGQSHQVFGEISHSKQTSSIAMRTEIYNALRLFGVPIRGEPPQEPQWNVTIYGPSAAQPGNSCYWYVSSNVPDANYQWRINGLPTETTQDFWYQPSSSFTLSVQVWNSSGGGGDDSKSVSVAYENGQCSVE